MNHRSTRNLLIALAVLGIGAAITAPAYAIFVFQGVC